MKKRGHIGGFLVVAFLVGTTGMWGPPLINQATAQSPVTLEVYDPNGPSKSPSSMRQTGGSERQDDLRDVQ